MDNGQYKDPVSIFDPVKKAPELVIKAHPSHQRLSTPEYFNRVLRGAGGKPQRRLTKLQFSILYVTVLCFILGGFFTYLGLKSSVVTGLQSASFRLTGDTHSNHKTGETNVSTDKISADTLASYTVAPNLPRYLIIPKLNVDARVLSVGTNSAGEIGTPYDIYDSAWYRGSSAPGQPGAMLIDGHVSGWSTKGVFYNLKTLVPGDTIQVVRGDGTNYTYKVVKSQVYPANNVNMKAALSPIVPGQPGLNLITCTGDVIRGTSEFSERVVVFTEQI